MNYFPSIYHTSSERDVLGGIVIVETIGMFQDIKLFGSDGGKSWSEKTTRFGSLRNTTNEKIDVLRIGVHVTKTCDDLYAIKNLGFSSHLLDY